MVRPAAGPPRTRRLRLMLVLVGLATFLAGCGDAFKAHPQNTFKSEGKQNDSILRLIWPVLGVAGIVFVLVLGGAVYVGLKFRARDDDDYNDFPKQIHGAFKAEIAWTILPALILAVVAVPTVFTIFELNAEPPSNAVHVEVIGQQWWWEYRYDLNNDGKYDEIVTANDLVMPVGREVALTVTSRDVIHSFWVPQLNGKRDAVPNRRHPWKLNAKKVGEYLGQCTEFCGLSHAEMRIKAVVVSEAEFAKWTAAQQKPAPTFADSDESMAAQGYRVFNQQLCSSCHLIDGVNNKKFKKDAPSGTISDRKLQVSRHAPQLTHLMSRSTFAGAKFNLRKDVPECRALGPDWADDDANLAKCLNRADLEAWLLNAPAQKAMAPDGVPGRTYTRGMPNLNLSADQVDQLVAYLMTLK